ncbi:MAG TPA: zf-HC2 domain-containing protein, partial [Levilinea sp.]|nr:zf-HC2 domain-containing protein [Levilinea sp.]
MHLKDDILRANLDGELDQRTLLDVSAHLERCSSCQQRLDALSRQAGRVAVRLAVLDPLPQESTRLAPQAWRRLPNKERQPMFKQYLRNPAWIALSIVLVLAISLAFQPVRALAGNFLDLFRVQQITLLPVDLSSLRGSMGEPTIAEAMGSMFSDSLVMTRQSFTWIETTGAQAASQEAGFTMRVSRDTEI